jgi:hypothetical protein
MKILLCSLLLSLAANGNSAVLLDDDWDDADRTDTNLPEESAWFGSTAAGSATLSAASNALTAQVRMFETNLSSRMWITHFSPPGIPTELGIGDTLRLTLNFVPRGVTTSNTTSRGFRIGLFNFSEPTAARVSADGFSTGTGGGAPGAGVTGYMLNMNFGQTLTANPLELMKRTDTANINLMGATAVFTRIGSTGGGIASSPGFGNDAPYSFEMLVRRFDGFVQITTTFSDTNGWSISHTVTDTANPTFRFDGFALRPNSVADTAEAFTLTRLKVETIPYALRITSARFKTPFVLELRWDSLPGKTYEVYWRNGLEPGEGSELLGTVAAQGSTATFDDGDVPFYLQRFYHVLQLP